MAGKARQGKATRQERVRLQEEERVASARRRDGEGEVADGFPSGNMGIE